MVRVRFAPSPTGNLHLGTLRTALFSWLFARNKKGTVVLRIEDTDLSRSDSKYEQSIIEGLEWLGLDFDEGPGKEGKYGPYRQSERIPKGYYKKYVDQLLSEGKAYYCFDTQEELDAEREAAEKASIPYVYSRKALKLSKEEVAKKLENNEAYTVRFKMPDGEFTFTDLVRGEITFDLTLLSDFVILKSDGTPSYNYACVVDDFMMDITHVIRGEDHISNTPRQIAIYNALGAKLPEFAHLPMILGQDKSKLSKRHGATNVTDYKEQGFLAETLFNFMCLLGWSSPDGKEIMSKEEIVQKFTLDRISKSGAVFDQTKLTWMNGQYLRSKTDEELVSLILTFIDDESLKQLKTRYSDTQISSIILSLRENLELAQDINKYLGVYLASFSDYKQSLSEFTFDEDNKKVIRLYKEKFSLLNDTFNTDSINIILEEILSETGFGKGKVLKPIRLATTGLGSGPNLMIIQSVIGKESVLERLEYLGQHVL